MEIWMKQIDRLAELRVQMKVLRDEARAIRKRVLMGEVALVGDEVIATVQRRIILRPVIDEAKPVAGNGVRHVPMEHPMWDQTRQNLGND
jgi:hypothetical protein